MRRTTVLGSAGALVAGTLIAGAMAAPAAGADGSRHGRGDAEARGVAVAAPRAADPRSDWGGRPGGWGRAPPQPCGGVSGPGASGR
ncbi:alpha/beta hydrolase, partial [Streptomyces anulatus]